eukprot:10001892-Heterocapsa_arctica.AAC.1
MVVEIEEGLKKLRTNHRSHRTRRKDWQWASTTKFGVSKKYQMIFQTTGCMRMLCRTGKKEGCPHD